MLRAMDWDGSGMVAFLGYERTRGCLMMAFRTSLRTTAAGFGLGAIAEYSRRASGNWTTWLRGVRSECDRFIMVVGRVCRVCRRILAVHLERCEVVTGAFGFQCVRRWQLFIPTACGRI